MKSPSIVCRFKRCVDKVDTSEKKWIQSLVHKIKTEYSELGFGHEVVTGLNLQLRNQYDTLVKSIAEYIFESFGDAMLPGKPNIAAKTLELFKLMKWPSIYKTYYMIALIQLIDDKVVELCEDKDYSICIVPALNDWLTDTLGPYVTLLFGTSEVVVTITKELHLAALSLLARTRSKELFEMIAEYPDCLPSLQELRDTVAVTDNMGFVGKSFRAVLCKRLLHMGASTTQILDFYVSMIKALRVLDPSDLMLTYVAVPIRHYLQRRNDAVRCIVASLTEGKESELHGELKQGGSLAYAPDEDDEEGGPGVNWAPRRRNKELLEPPATAAAAAGGGGGGAGAGGAGAAGGAGGGGGAGTGVGAVGDAGAISRNAASKGMDTLALLVSIYGSTDLFIVEYRSLLADKLLTSTGYLTDHEVANLELLKIRYVIYFTYFIVFNYYAKYLLGYVIYLPVVYTVITHVLLETEGLVRNHCTLARSC
jgi:hypothetical protein